MPYMYHCHMLVHEDGGMMGAFVVVDPAAEVVETGSDLRGWAVPNPAGENVRIGGLTGYTRVVGPTGKLVREFAALPSGTSLDCTGFAAGVYVAVDTAGRTVRFVLE
jgi:hypothetical protein